LEFIQKGDVSAQKEDTAVALIETMTNYKDQVVAQIG
jgi:hypothetical protein